MVHGCLGGLATACGLFGRQGHHHVLSFVGGLGKMGGSGVERAWCIDWWCILACMLWLHVHDRSEVILRALTLILDETFSYAFRLDQQVDELRFNSSICLKSPGTTHPPTSLTLYNAPRCQKLVEVQDAIVGLVSTSNHQIPKTIWISLLMRVDLLWQVMVWYCWHVWGGGRSTSRKAWRLLLLPWFLLWIGPSTPLMLHPYTIAYGS